MRTVFLFPPGTPDEARRTLDSAFPRNGGTEEWLVDRGIWVRIVDPPFWDDWSAEEIGVVERSVGDRRPATMIQADVSGRIDGQKEVVRLCRALLNEDGVATDDYSDRCWSLTEILDSVGSLAGFFRPRSTDDDASSDGTFPLTIVNTDYGICITTVQFGDWRDAQDAFDGYKASLGPWRLEETLEYLAFEYPDQPSFANPLVRGLAASEDATLWAKQLNEDEQANVPANVRAVAAAAGELLDRLDDLFDERPDALLRLLSSIDDHMPDIRESLLGRVAADARSRLTDAQRAQLGASTLNRQALAATDELRLVCAATWAEDDAHAAVEHERLDELRRLLDAGWDVDNPTVDGMTLLHHAIDIEVDAAAQTGEPLAVELTELLVARGADLGHRWHGRTPLEAAKERGHHLAVTVIEAAGRAAPGDGTIGPTPRPWWAFWRRWHL